MSQRTLIYASMMCADWRNLERDILSLQGAGIDGFHFDIMDGRFVPNLTMGFDVIRALRSVTDLPFDLHLMVEEPERYIDQCKEVGAQSVSIHIESTRHAQRLLHQMKMQCLNPIVALVPSTPLDTLEYLWDELWGVLIMTVDPGFAGQRAIPTAVNKIADAKELVALSRKQVMIQVDGNVSLELAPLMVRKGADILIGGTSSLFRPDIGRREALEELRRALRSA